MQGKTIEGIFSISDLTNFHSSNVHAQLLVNHAQELVPWIDLEKLSATVIVDMQENVVKSAIQDTLATHCHLVDAQLGQSQIAILMEPNELFQMDVANANLKLLVNVAINALLVLSS